MHFRRGPGGHQRAKRRWRNLIVFLLPIVIIFAFSTWLLLPPKESPAPSDAVLVIASSSDGRHELGAQLVQEGVSQNFVVSNPSGTWDEVGSAHCRGADRPEAASETWCMLSTPITTAGEALAIGELAAEEGWSIVTAVTSRSHARRVNTMLNQCTDLDATVVFVNDASTAYVPYRVVYEVGAYLKFWLNNPC